MCFLLAEIYIESSKNYKQQGNKYSTYKGRTTAKFLIGVTPSGAVCYVGEGFEVGVVKIQLQNINDS